MAGLVPAISIGKALRIQNRDARAKPAHDATTFVRAGLVPAISKNWLRLCDIIIQITPRLVFLCNEPRFPNAWPMFDIFLALNRTIGGIVDFKIDQAIDSVVFCVAMNHFIFVFVNTADEIARHADIKRATWTTREDVNIELSHVPSFADRDGRDKPGHDAC
jgi:hypothetical protein